MARELVADHHGHRIHVEERPGDEPAIVLMHGFPDNRHLYDRVLPFLDGRRVVTFDFLGWGRSDKPVGYPHTATNQIGEVGAVMDALDLDEAVLVAHDASGPPAIDWAFSHPRRVAGLVLLNTYYGWHPALRAPEAIALYSTPVLRNLARAVVRRNERLDERLFTWQVGRFIRDADVRAELVPQLYADFRAARPAFWRLNDDLLGTVVSRRLRSGRLRDFDRPVRIVFGAADPYLNRRVAKRLHRLFPTSELHLLPTARHYVQVDEPQRVADLISSTGA
ncbi:alpha/beta fold hydrolase [Pseudonocardia cypriaca]|uniref:Pimeloyl-ACP methyl ester carboxylesterase n=1 Tax=Pseudonocardia cypriaca TaxID=882449 RepID=A0A543GJ14_9PSEU|nr:alpha/beta hydrolase [Pseudonocardia cypriaca]TQM46046.1 pimeloyl-ACP methyl ester carboxylesterase [Pseudonocardia cypriaca]